MNQQIDNRNVDKSRQLVANWLFVVCFLIFLIVVVGGATRLTRSGLSIVEWKPLSGIVPPLSTADWQKEFAAYQKYPEFQKINTSMDLDQFKGIYYWEYVHRLLGRIIGLAFFLPFVFFWWKGYLHGMSKTVFIVMFLLGALQGFMGWFMVKSGLVNMPHVSHYRLASHLLLAFVLYSFIFYQALKIRRHSGLHWSIGQLIGRPSGPLRLWILVAVVLVLQIFYGALVAGLKAGLLANTFPLINGQWIPDTLLDYDPTWLALLELPVSVQFIHRTLAWSLVLLVPFFCFKMWNVLTQSRILLISMLVGLVLQFLIGVLVLLLHVPVLLGVLHQAGALVLLSIFLLLLYDINHKIDVA